MMWPAGTPEEVPVGTYRASDGGLVHVREHHEGGLVVEAERGTRVSPDSLDLAGLLKLSDDPFWPDLQPEYAGFALD